MLRSLLKSPSAPATNVPAPLSQEQRAALAHFPHASLATMATKAQCWPFPEHLDNPNCKWLQALKHVYAQPITFPASLSPQAGQLLHAIVLNAQPTTVIETGTFLGISTIWMAAALELSGRGHIHCIDDFRPIKPGRWRAEGMPDGRDAKVREHLDRAGLTHRVTIHNASSAAGITEVAEHLGAMQKSSGVQLAFLDADHTPAGVRAEFAALEPILNTGGYVILHDIYPEISRWRGPRELLDTIDSVAAGRYEQIDLYLAPANFGLGVLRRIG